MTDNMIFEQTIAHYIHRHGLMRHDGFYLVALSGGADSVALLCVLRRLGYHVEAVHCNFHLRGEESNRDENFCVSLCAKMGMPLHRVHFDTTTYATLHKMSIEMAARELRYGYFERLRKDLGADGICVAHHQDDQVETVLLNLVRGTGLAGLQGMKPRNGNIIRPMLTVSRAEVERYLSDIEQEYVIDSTNLVDCVMRNKLRLDIIPQLEKLNPAVKKNIFRMTENLGEVNKIVDKVLQNNIDLVRLDDTSYDLKAIRKLTSPAYVLWEILNKLGFNRTQMLEILSHESGGGQWEAKDYVAVVDRERLEVVAKKWWNYKLPVLRIPEVGVYSYATIPRGKAALDTKSDEMKVRFSFQTIDANFHIDRRPEVATLDADKLSFPLLVRPIGKGDRFVPFGMQGTKLVGDFLTDNKVSPIARRRQLVVENADKNIVWLVGCRIDNRYGIDPNRSQKALVISLE